MTQGEWPVPPSENVVADLRDTHRTRRHIVMTVGGAAAYMVVRGSYDVAVNYLTGEVWPDTHTEILLVEGTGAQKPNALPNNPWIAFGGLGRQHNLDQARIVANTLLGSLASGVKVGGFSYANQGISLRDNARCLDDYVEGYDGINVLGHSMGSITALESLLLMQKPVHIDRFIAVSSPFELDDVFRKDDLSTAVKMGADGDIDEKFLFSILSDPYSSRRDIFSRISDVVTRSARKTPSGVSPKVYVDALKIVYWARLMSLVGEFKNKGIITDRTKFIYCKSPRDGTVKTERACNSYEGFARALGAFFGVVEFDGGHADSRAACREVNRKYSRWLNEALEV